MKMIVDSSGLMADRSEWFASKEEAISDAVNKLYEDIQKMEKEKQELDDAIWNNEKLIEELKNS